MKTKITTILTKRSTMLSIMSTPNANVLLRKTTTATSRDVMKQNKYDRANQQTMASVNAPYDPYRKKSHHQPASNADPDFDADLQRALEESKKEEDDRQKKIRREDEEKRAREAARRAEEERRRREQAQMDQLTSGFDHGFSKYDTNAQAQDFQFQESAFGGGGANDFDFSSFGNIEPKPRQQTVVEQSKNKIDELDDLLGGMSSNPQPSEQQNALDFFEQNDISFQPAQPAQQQQDSQDIFGNGSQQQADPFGHQAPMQQQQQQPAQAEMEKPK